MSKHLFRWTHVTATYEEKDDDQIGKLYINGKLVNTTHNLGSILWLETSVMIGSTTGNHFYTGLADEIRFFR